MNSSSHWLLLYRTGRYRPTEDAIANEQHCLLGFFGGKLPGLPPIWMGFIDQQKNITQASQNT